MGTTVGFPTGHVYRVLSRPTRGVMMGTAPLQAHRHPFLLQAAGRSAVPSREIATTGWSASAEWTLPDVAKEASDGAGLAMKSRSHRRVLMGSQSAPGFVIGAVRAVSVCHIPGGPLHVRVMSHQKASDARLLAASIDDATAFRELYDRYAARIESYHRRRCRDEQAALDLVAETFAQAWCVRRSFRDLADGSAAPWLYGIARNVLLQSVRRKRLEDAARERLGLLEHLDAPQIIPNANWLEGVDELLDGLPTDQRQAVQMRVVQDMSYQRIAADLAISPENARARVHRALKALRLKHTTMTGEL